MPTKRRTPAQKKLQKLLRQTREDADLKQAELAKKLGRPQSFVSKYETGERHLTLIEIEEICKAVDVPLITFVRRYQRKK